MAEHLNPPQACDICHEGIEDEFFDFKTTSGPWANGCPKCFKRVGLGTGTGLGQQYKKNDQGRFEKIAG